MYFFMQARFIAMDSLTKTFIMLLLFAGKSGKSRGIVKIIANTTYLKRLLFSIHAIRPKVNHMLLITAVKLFVILFGKIKLDPKGSSRIMHLFHVKY